MTKRIFRSIFLAALAVLLASLVIVFGVLYEYFTGMQYDTLAAQAQLAARGVEQEGMAYLDGITTGGCRLTWVGADGTVLFDSAADAAAMENHADREEIREALERGSGEGERTSRTLMENTLYHAQRLNDGTVLRASVTQYTVLTLLVGMTQPICIVLALALVLCGVLASRLSKRIVDPLARIDLDHPLENDAYEELSPLLTRVERQHRQIEEQVAQLERRQDEFAAVTGSMSEGLVLLNDRGYILSINNAAIRLFGTDEGCVGRDVLTVERGLGMQRLVEEALAGRPAETVITRDSAEYQVRANPVMSDGRLTGVCILAFDVTQREQAERQRREFSANVSHELKTPLHSIMGSAELIENGLVKPEDMPRFVGHIRTEAGRLVTLIDDIIRLSQLDEGGELPRERVDLKAVAEEAVRAVGSEAERRGVTVRLKGEPTDTIGVRRLLYEIAYNLCDNAVKYNADGGWVEVEVSGGAEAPTLTVRDNGAGIPVEAQSRVFERFYRVDKSHSKETGGTGLGLSIVKHAAQVHGARIELESALGKGTRITVRFQGEK